MFVYPNRRAFALSAFTLSELLIALAILGLIATFAIPKVLQTLGENQKKAIAKETISALHEALYSGWLSGEITQDSTIGQVGDFLASELNVVQDCQPGRATGNCVTSYSSPGHFDTSNRILVLHNGAWISLYGTDSLAFQSIFFMIDYNGALGPNADTHHGGGTPTTADSTALIFNPTLQQITSDTWVHGTNFIPGSLVPDHAHGNRRLVYKYWMDLP